MTIFHGIYKLRSLLGKCNMQEKNIKIGLVGFGTVGAGVAKIILENANSIAAKTGQLL